MNNTPSTLLAMQGAPLHPSPLNESSLVMIDLQEEYRKGGLPLPNIDTALREAAAVLELARKHGVPIFHIQHSLGTTAPIFNSDLPTFELMPEVDARDGESRVIKKFPNAFNGTDLDEQLRRTGRSQIIFVGAMTHACISSTVRAALDLGYRSTVVADACATRDLPSIHGGVIKAEDVHQATLAALADAFAVITPNASAWQ